MIVCSGFEVDLQNYRVWMIKVLLKLCVYLSIYTYTYTYIYIHSWRPSYIYMSIHIVTVVSKLWPFLIYSHGQVELTLMSKVQKILLK